MIIDWNGLSLPEWEEKFARVRRAPLLQSYSYARAACPLHRQRARWGLIRRADGTEAGLVQLLEAGILGNALHAVQLDRGPLWFEGCGGEGDVAGFFHAFARDFPKRPGRRRRVLPELPDSAPARALMERLGYRRLARTGYSTVWLDLRPGETALRAGLRGKWRNGLNGAERAGLRAEWDGGTAALPALLTLYAQDKVARGYGGASVPLLQNLAKNFSPAGRMLTGTVSLGNEQVSAFTLFFLHGKSATYQVGWTSEAGKRANAHNLLLWQACLELKRRGIHDFDLGGVNDETAGGVKHFKEGMGGETVTYLGHYV